MLLNTKRRNGESMKNFEKRFTAQMTRLNSISATNKLPECITPFFCWPSSVSGTQRVTELADTAPTNANPGKNSSNDDILQSVTYDAVSAVVNQCDFIQSVDHTTHFHAFSMSSFAIIVTVTLMALVTRMGGRSGSFLNINKILLW